MTRPHRNASRTAAAGGAFTGTVVKSANRLWGAHVRVPAPLLRRLTAGNSRRVVRTLNGSAPHQCALLPVGGGAAVVAINRTWMKRLGVSPGDRIAVTLRPDTSTYGLPVPAELRELFRQDPEGRALFHALTPGRQRTLLYLAGRERSSARRAWRSAIVISHLKRNSGTIRYRLLHAELRETSHQTV